MEKWPEYIPLSLGNKTSSIKYQEVDFNSIFIHQVFTEFQAY